MPIGRSIRVALTIVLVLAALLPASASAATRASSEQPDLIAIIVDDLGYIPNDRVLRRLPNIKRVFLEGGQRFTNMHGETPRCCPARASLLTGQHTLHHGVVLNDGDFLDPEATIAIRLDAAGYHTMLIGKYLNAYQGTRTPPGWDRVVMRNGRKRYHLDGVLQRYSGNFNKVVRKRTFDLIGEAPADEPLFAWVAPTAPHFCRWTKGRACYHPDVMTRDQGARRCRRIPAYKPPGYRTRTSTRSSHPMPRWRKGWKLRQVCESMLVVDRMVKAIDRAMERRGRDAYLFFLSDNGMAWGRKGYTFKQNPFSTRMPFYVAGPDVPAGTKESALLSTIDFAPTLAALAGTDMPDADGRSFLGAWKAGSHGGRDEMLEVQVGRAEGTREGWSAIRTPDWHFIRWNSGRRELYDLRADPWEVRNLAKRDRETAVALDARRKALLEASKSDV